MRRLRRQSPADDRCSYKVMIYICRSEVVNWAYNDRKAVISDMIPQPFYVNMFQSCAFPRLKTKIWYNIS